MAGSFDVVSEEAGFSDDSLLQEIHSDGQMLLLPWLEKHPK